MAAAADQGACMNSPAEVPFRDAAGHDHNGQVLICVNGDILRLNDVEMPG